VSEFASGRTRARQVGDTRDGARARARGFFAVALLISCGLALAATAGAGAPPDTVAMRSALEMMRRTERAFARTTAEIGVRNGFGMFFASDAIMPPDSVSTNRFLQKPAPVGPSPTTLEWEPLTGDVSRSLDLGWLTGPFSYRDGSGARHDGVYFSIWRRGADGLWRVALDAGIATPARAPEFADSAFRAWPGPRWADSLDAARGAAALAELKQTEAAFLAATAADSRAAYAGALAAPARVHRDGRVPLVARDSILALVATERTRSAHLIRAELSAAGDLGWTFGITSRRGASGPLASAFTRIWKRDDTGRWRIVVDISSPSGD
jgi:ketosteroid isomerase-like protein